MKYLIILGDGMADEPIEEFGGKTPLQVASTPSMDWIACNGRSGLLNSVPSNYEPGSEVANLSILGYNLDEVFEGRGALEAASMGIPIEDGEMAMRCNLICMDDQWRIKNHSSGHISTEEATELINCLQRELGGGSVNFYPGVSYRHLLKVKGGNKNVICTPPHNVPGVPIADVLVQPTDKASEETADLLNNLIVKSQAILERHPINKKRQAEGKDPANTAWPWSPGYRPRMQTLQEKFGISSGAVISAVDLIKGIGVYAGLTPIEVEGATGLYDTNYEGKAEATIEALRKNDFVYLHVEASDEAGHEGDYELKKKTIEYLDKRIIEPILKAMPTLGDELTIAVLPDHPTPCRIKTHTSNPVPFAIYKPGVKPDDVEEYNETSAKRGSYGTLTGEEFIKELFKKES